MIVSRRGIGETPLLTPDQAMSGVKLLPWALLAAVAALYMMSRR